MLSPMEGPLKDIREAMKTGGDTLLLGRRMFWGNNSDVFCTLEKKRIRTAMRGNSKEMHVADVTAIPSTTDRGMENTDSALETGGSLEHGDQYAINLSPKPEAGYFNIIRQQRRGGRHGRGGRKPGPSAEHRRAMVSNDISQLLGQTLIALCGGSVEGFITVLKDTFQRIIPEKTWDEFPNMLRSNMEEVVRGKTKKIFEIVGAPIPVICIKLSYSQTGAGELFAKDKHVICCWLNENGRVYCTCVGSTQFRINLDTEEFFSSSSTEGRKLCSHMKGMMKLLDLIAISLNVSLSSVISYVLDIYARYSDASFGQWLHSLQTVTSHHNLTVSLLCELIPGRTKNVQFIPIRMLKKGTTMSCGYCDTVQQTGCYHVSKVRRISYERTQEDETIIAGTIEPDGVGELYEDLESDNEESRSIPNHKSVLPLSPLSCKRSIEVDEFVGNTAKRREPYRLSAPVNCELCGCYRNPKTEQMWEGVIMCTVGPCVLHVETFRCGNSSCGHLIETEGREHCVLIGKTTAATHALLRRELIGVVMSNGTLSSRLNHYHSQVQSLMEYGVLPFYPACRSTRTLQDLCKIMLTLMAMNPDKSLFLCSKCDESDNDSPSRRTALCIDGIYQGYLRNKQVVLRNISQECSSIPASHAASSGPKRRPLTSILRRSETGSILFAAIRGHKIMVEEKNVKDVAAVIRIISPQALPPQFCSESICGRTFNDYYDDIGEDTMLQALSHLTLALFHRDTLLYRLVQPLYSFVNNCFTDGRVAYLQMLVVIPRSTNNVTRRRRRVFKDDLDKILSRLVHTRSEQVVDGNCWTTELRTTGRHSAHHDARREILDLYKMIVQGPITQFIKRTDILSLQQTGYICLETSNEHLLRILQAPDKLEIPKFHTNILKSCRTIKAALFSAVNVERKRSETIGRNLRQAFGYILLRCAEFVEKFYSYYDATHMGHSAVAYSEKWEHGSAADLRERLVKAYVSETALLSENCFQVACKTGFYFPSLPQVRPLPFDVDSGNPEEEHGPCTKNYKQIQRSYTPGAVTVTCSCKNAVSYGAKILSKEEGTKGVLDTIKSRFPVMPSYIVYDFACGLYNSAVHSLWWSLGRTRIVSDKFHYKNHTCSPGFFPMSYTELDHSNTVSHEQRNRGIAALCKTLRNSSQEFYISLLGYHMVIMNIRSKAKCTKRFEERDRLFTDYDLEWCYFHCLEMSCPCCLTQTSIIH